MLSEYEIEEGRTSFVGRQYSFFFGRGGGSLYDLLYIKLLARLP